jgi:EamA domain-containing membrane protein RarD
LTSGIWYGIGAYVAWGLLPLYGEPFTGAQFIGFAIVWAGLVVFGLDGLVSRRAPMAAIIDEREGARSTGSR